MDGFNPAFRGAELRKVCISEEDFPPLPAFFHLVSILSHCFGNLICPVHFILVAHSWIPVLWILFVSICCICFLCHLEPLLRELHSFWRVYFAVYHPFFLLPSLGFFPFHHLSGFLLHHWWGLNSQTLYSEVIILTTAPQLFILNMLSCSLLSVKLEVQVQETGKI